MRGRVGRGWLAACCVYCVPILLWERLRDSSVSPTRGCRGSSSLGGPCFFAGESGSKSELTQGLVQSSVSTTLDGGSATHYSLPEQTFEVTYVC